MLDLVRPNIEIDCYSDDDIHFKLGPISEFSETWIRAWTLAVSSSWLQVERRHCFALPCATRTLAYATASPQDLLSDHTRTRAIALFVTTFPKALWCAVTPPQTSELQDSRVQFEFAGVRLHSAHLSERSEHALLRGSVGRCRVTRVAVMAITPFKMQGDKGYG